MVLTAPGINCDRETLQACRVAGADAELVHVNQLESGARRVDDFALLLIPGGFSYGDHLGAGSLLATVLRHHYMDNIAAFVDSGRPLIGICNGFQVLARLGLLGPVALAGNVHGRFECRWVELEEAPSPCPFLTGLDGARLPIAHGEGRVVVWEEHLKEVAALAPLRYRENPNGSTEAIAAVCSPGGNVLGLMPHPERSITNEQRPNWTERAMDEAGRLFFENVVRYAAA
jgi:phosphoribosylformylglycinamidine synthase